MFQSACLFRIAKRQAMILLAVMTTSEEMYSPSKPSKETKSPELRRTKTTKKAPIQRRRVWPLGKEAKKMKNHQWELMQIHPSILRTRNLVAQGLMKRTKLLPLGHLHPTTMISLPKYRTKKRCKSHPSRNHNHQRHLTCDSIDAVVLQSVTPWAPLVEQLLAQE